jgi:6,7-dimethyl-8-ribityllumazine synthase
MTHPMEGKLDAKGMRFVLVVSRTNDFVANRLLSGAEDCLERHGSASDARTVVRVPGSWELPQAVARLASTGKFDAVIAVGALIRGETPHFDVLAAEVAKGLAEIAIRSGVPVAFGVVTADSLEQAIERAGAKAGNKGWDAALAAVEMVSLFRQMA